jgi:hypothetical protein
MLLLSGYQRYKKIREKADYNQELLSRETIPADAPGQCLGKKLNFNYFKIGGQNIIDSSTFNALTLKRLQINASKIVTI